MAFEIIKLTYLLTYLLRPKARITNQSDAIHWSCFLFSRQCRRYSDSGREQRGTSLRHRWRTPIHDHSASSVDAVTPSSNSWTGNDPENSNLQCGMVYSLRFVEHPTRGLRHRRSQDLLCVHFSSPKKLTTILVVALKTG